MILLIQRLAVTPVSLTICFVSLNIPMECRGCLIIIMILSKILLILRLVVSTGYSLDYNNVLPEYNLTNTMACSKLDHLSGGCVLGVHLQVAQLER